MRTECSSTYAGALSHDAPIVFVHGSLSSSRIWEPYAAAFSARESIAIDLPGYGDEPAWPAQAEYRLHDAASSIRRTLKGRSEPVDMVAHSFGGAVALRYALDNPISVRTLTLIEPSWFGVLRDLGPKARPALKAIRGIGGGFEEIATDDGRLFAMGRFVDYWNGRGIWSELPRHRQEMLALKSDQIRRDFEAIFSERLRLAAFRHLSIPTLIVTGTTSPAAALFVAEALTRATPFVSCVSVPGAGHTLPVTHPADLIGILRPRLEIEARPMLRAA